MAAKKHHYQVTVAWIGNTGTGTKTYHGYERAHNLTAEGKPMLLGSSDPAFLGDTSKWNPEELLIASLSACHKLWYLGLCSQAGIVVIAYEDVAEGVMIEETNGAGQFISVTLRPNVVISSDSDEVKAANLHHKAHEMCFIARSMNFPVENEAKIIKKD
jgi:organic hydroperoxide reductase OsmC/OhrA